MAKFVLVFVAIGIMAGGFGLSVHSVVYAYAVHGPVVQRQVAGVRSRGMSVATDAIHTRVQKRVVVHHTVQPVVVAPTAVPTQVPQKPVVVKTPQRPVVVVQKKLRPVPHLSGSRWYLFPLSLQYGDSNASGYEHGVDVGTPPNTPITALLAGVITDISSPGWGRQMTWQLDTPLHGALYMYQIHLAALNPQLAIGSHITAGTTIGWSGGAYTSSQMLGTTNPTGVNYLDSSAYTSGPHTEVGLTGGPVYGSGDGYPLYPSATYDIRGLLYALRA